MAERDGGREESHEKIAVEGEMDDEMTEADAEQVLREFNAAVDSGPPVSGAQPGDESSAKGAAAGEPEMGEAAGDSTGARERKEENRMGDGPGAGATMPASAATDAPMDVESARPAAVREPSAEAPARLLAGDDGEPSADKAGPAGPDGQASSRQQERKRERSEEKDPPGLAKQQSPGPALREVPEPAAAPATSLVPAEASAASDDALAPGSGKKQKMGSLPGASAGDADMKEESGKRNYSPLPAMSSPMKHAGEAQRNDADGGAPDPSPASMGANWGHVAESVQQVSPEPAKAEDGEVSAEQKQEMEIERDQQKTAKDSDRTPLEMQVDAVGAGGQSEETSKEELKSERPKCGSAEKRATAEKGLSGEPLLAVQAPASTPVQESAQTPESRTPVLTAAADDGHGCSGSGSPVPQPPPDYIPPVAASPAQALAVATPASGLQSLAMPFSAGAALKSGEALLHASKPQVPAPYLRKGRPLRPTCDSTGASSNVEPMSKALHENFDSVSLQALANDSTTASTPIGKVSDVPYAHTPKSDLRPAADPRLQYEPFLAQVQASASQQMATPDTNGRGEDTPGSTQEESAQGRGRPGRKPKDLPPGFERVVDGTDKPYWLAPDKTKCTKWPQVEAWLAKRQAGSTPGSGAQSKSVGGKGVGGPTPTRGDFKIGRAVENPIEPERTEKYDVFDPPQDIAEFLGFVVFYLLHHENEDDAYDLINLSPPSIHGVDVNLCELFHHVRELGGVEKMHMRLWKSVLQTMKLPASTQDANTINLIYERFLVCCEGKSWNKEELQKNANRVAGSDKRANLKTLLRRGLLRVGQEFTWKKRRVDYEAEGREPKPDNLEPAAVGKLNEDGHIEFEGSTYKSLNAFAGAAFMHFDIGPKARADKLDGWNSVKTKGTDGRLKSVQQIKNDYHRSNADTMRNAMLRPRELFSNQAHGLRQQKNQAEMREREEKERQQQLEHAKLLAENPPPAWIHPQYDQRYLEEVENGTREATVSMDLEKMIVDLETGTSQDDLDLAENALQQIVDSVLKPTPLTARYHLTLQCITLSPMVLNRLTKCCWGWLCKSSYSAPYGKWQINMNTVKYRLQSELDPKKGRMHWRKQGLARSSIGAPYTASKLPPGWRREERIPDAGPLVHLKKVFYTYFAPDGKTFTRWPDALAYFIETEEAKLKDAEKATAEAGFFDQAAAEGDAGTSGAEEEKGAEDDGDEDGAEDEEEDDEMGDVDDQERRQQQQQQRPSEATSAPGGGAQLWWPPATCRLVMRDLVFGQSFQVTREGGLQAARCARLARAYILMLKHVCLLREGMARVGSHGPTVQLLIEIITADLPAANDSSTPIDTLCLQLLNGIAHVINLKVSPGKRLLTAISHAIRAQGNGAERNRMRLELVHLLARLADCPHNKQVMAEQEHQVLPTVLPLFMFPQGVGGYQMLSMALDAVHRFCLFDAIPSVLRRLNGTPGCIAALVRIVCGAYEPPHRRDQAWRPEGAGKVQLSDRIHAARVLLKVAEGSGGIASLQRHEKELVQAIVGNSPPLGSDSKNMDQLRVLMAGILHALVPTEAPYLRMLEHYEPAEHAAMHVSAAAIETEESNESGQIIETARLARRKITNREQSVSHHGLTDAEFTRCLEQGVDIEEFVRAKKNRTERPGRVA